MKQSVKSWILLVILACIWGSSFILMKLSMYDYETHAPLFTNNQVATLRMFLAALFLAPIAFKHIHHLKSLRNLLLLSIVGFFGNFFPAYLFTFAETELSSGYTGMLNSFTPIFAILISALLFHQKLTKQQLFGVAVGTCGIIALTFSGADLSSRFSLIHVGAVLLATLCYAISLNTIKNTLQHIPSIQLTALAFGTTLIPSTLLLFGTEVPQTVHQTPGINQGIYAIITLGLIGTAFAVVLFTQLIATSSVLFASSVTYLIPIVAMLIGLAFGEIINLYQIASMFLILSGVLIANKKSR